MQAEAAETANLNAAAIAQHITHLLNDAVNGKRNVFFRQMR